MLHYVPVAMVILAVSCGSAFAAYITVKPSNNQYVLKTSTEDVEYNCTSDFGDVLWQLFEYQMVDIDQYQTRGVEISGSGRFSILRITQTGRDYLVNEFKMSQPFNASQQRERCGVDFIDVQCFALYDSVRIKLGAQYRIVVNDLRIRTYYEGENTMISWCAPTLPDTPTLTYNITIRDTSNSSNQITTETTDLYYNVPSSFSCENCEIAVFYESNKQRTPGVGVETVITARIPCSFDITEVQDSLNITISGPNVSVEFNPPSAVAVDQITVTLNDLCPCFCSLEEKEVLLNGDITGNVTKVTFYNVRADIPGACTPVYIATIELCAGSNCQTTSIDSDGDLSETMYGEVVQFESSSCFSSSRDICLAATVNGITDTQSLTISENSSLLTFPIAGNDVVFYECQNPCLVRPASIRIAQSDEDFPCAGDRPPTPDDPTDPPVVIVVIIIIVCSVVAVLILLVILVALISIFIVKKKKAVTDERKLKEPEEVKLQKTEKL